MLRCLYTAPAPSNSPFTPAAFTPGARLSHTGPLVFFPKRVRGVLSPGTNIVLSCDSATISAFTSVRPVDFPSTHSASLVDAALWLPAAVMWLPCWLPIPRRRTEDECAFDSSLTRNGHSDASPSLAEGVNKDSSQESSMAASFEFWHGAMPMCALSGAPSAAPGAAHPRLAGASLTSSTRSMGAPKKVMCGRWAGCLKREGARKCRTGC
mmetsp:Transcript_42454/g.90411  ORF Transcript_42454/g.90411 Transcript_42454/m.90411 type:complete len:210 (-) Transcript_42454:34-663(-)